MWKNYPDIKAETIPVRNIPSKTPAPPIETNPPKLRIFLRFNKSAPINVPKTPEIKAQGAVKLGIRIKEKITENKGGIKMGKVIPLPGTILE